MKYLLIVYLLLISQSLYAATNCRDATNLANANDCFFKIESSVPNQVIINPSFDLKTDYKILYKVNSGVFDTEGRPLFSTEKDYSALTGQAKTNSPIKILNEGDKLQITGAGYYQIRLKNKTDNNIHWSQWVYVPYPEPSNARILAEKYMPIISFAESEEYLPRKIEDILSDPRSINSILEIDVRDFTGNTKIKMGNPMIDFLTNKGHDNFIIPNIANNRKALQKNTNPNEQNPVVYYHAIETTKYIYLSYYYLYNFDPKSGTSNAPASGAHTFDREGLIITLQKDQNNTPLSVTYGSHLPLTPSEYLGCKDDKLTTCKQQKNKITTISNGKVKLNWTLIPKKGDHLVAYAAKGSHALYPAYGWYKVKVPFTTITTHELAGNFDGFNTRVFKPTNLIKIDNRSVFAFSGYWIDGIATLNSKFPPFIRYPDSWAADPLDPSFYDGCLILDEKDASTKCKRLKNYFPPKNLIGFIQNKITITGKLTNLPAFRDKNKPILVHFNGTRAEAVVGADGRFSIEVDTNSRVNPNPDVDVDLSLIGDQNFFFLEPILIFSLDDTTHAIHWIDDFGSSSTIDLGTVDFTDENAPIDSIHFGGIQKSCPMP